MANSGAEAHSEPTCPPKAVPLPPINSLPEHETPPVKGNQRAATVKHFRPPIINQLPEIEKRTRQRIDAEVSILFIELIHSQSLHDNSQKPNGAIPRAGSTAGSERRVWSGVGLIAYTRRE